MSDIQNDTNYTQSAAEILGKQIRDARKLRGWNIAELASKLGRPREWLNRIELGYSEQGEYRPASKSDLQTIIDYIGDKFTASHAELMDLVEASEQDFYRHRNQTKKPKRNSYGKLTQTEVIVGEAQVVEAIVDLINEQHSDAVIRNTGIKSLGSYKRVADVWKNYRLALGQFLTDNPNALFKRVEYVATPEQLQNAKEADMNLAGGRELASVHNVKLKFQLQNPLQLHAIIGQREAILALPQVSGQAGSNMAILVRDKVFVDAMRVWYDEVLWDAPADAKTVEFTDFDQSFSDIGGMYGFDSKN